MNDIKPQKPVHPKPVEMKTTPIVTFNFVSKPPNRENKQEHQYLSPPMK